MGGKVRRFRPLHGVSCTAWTMRGSSDCRLVRCSVLWTIRVDVGAGCLVRSSSKAIIWWKCLPTLIEGSGFQNVLFMLGEPVHRPEILMDPRGFAVKFYTRQGT
ncbi:hypothetical protein V6N13_143820 [Hibiscus sabdariffa]